MTQIDPGKIQSSSLTPGLQDLGSAPEATITYSGTIPAKSYLQTTIPLVFPHGNVIGSVRLHITGTGRTVDNYWFPINGTYQIIVPQYIIFVTVGPTTNGRLVTLKFVNNLNNAPVTLPTLTITADAHMYNYPW